MTDQSKPPHMDPMSPDEVRELLSATMHGPLPKPTMQRVFATLAAWASKVDQASSPQATPIGQRVAVERFAEFMQRAGADDCYDVGEALEVMQQLADSITDVVEPNLGRAIVPPRPPR